MHTFQLRQTIASALADVAEAEPFLNAVSTVSMVFDAMTEQLQLIAEGGAKLPEATAALHAKCAGLARVTAGINPRRFYLGLERLQQALRSLAPPVLADGKLLADVAQGVEEFAAGYDAFLARPSGRTAIPLILMARKLNDRMPLFMNTLGLLHSMNEDTSAPAAGCAELTLLLPAVSSLPGYAQRLMALDALYAETCLLLAVSRAEFPLRIAKLSTGGMWVRVSGESRAVAWMAEFTVAAARFLYRNYSTDAKFAASARTNETIDMVLGLSQRLKDAGFDAGKVAQHVTRAAPAVFKELATLMEGQPSVTVNQAVVSIGDELNKVLLKDHARAV